MTKREIAIANFVSGLNCAQAVLLAFKDEIGISEEILKKGIVGFGGGFGRQRLVCGAVCGMTSAIGFLAPKWDDKIEVYKIVKEACDLFSKATGSLICEDLKKEGAKVSCADVCGIAAECVEKVLLK